MIRVPGNVYLPDSEGEDLSSEDKLKLAELIYNRFHYYEGMYVWRDDRTKAIREKLVTQVEQVLDAIKLTGIKCNT